MCHMEAHINLLCHSNDTVNLLYDNNKSELPSNLCRFLNDVTFSVANKIKDEPRSDENFIHFYMMK